MPQWPSARANKGKPANYAAFKDRAARVYSVPGLGEDVYGMQRPVL